MASTLVDRIKEAFNRFGDTDEDIYDDDEYMEQAEEIDETEDLGTGRLWGSKKSKVVNMAQPVKVVISQPTTFEQAEDICDLLKDKQSVIVNLEYVNKEVARRIIDVVSGATHALDGHIQKVSNSIFLIAPYNYEITSDLARDEIKSKLAVSWLSKNSNAM